MCWLCVVLCDVHTCDVADVEQRERIVDGGDQSSHV